MTLRALERFCCSLFLAMTHGSDKFRRWIYRRKILCSPVVCGPWRTAPLSGGCCGPDAVHLYCRIARHASLSLDQWRHAVHLPNYRQRSDGLRRWRPPALVLWRLSVSASIVIMIATIIIAIDADTDRRHKTSAGGRESFRYHQPPPPRRWRHNRLMPAACVQTWHLGRVVRRRYDEMRCW